VIAFGGCSLLGKGVLDDKPLESELTGGGGTGTGTGMPVGGGGSGGCQSPSECPGLDATCRFRTCEAGACGFANAEPLVSCNEDGGTVCDGDGGCVECIGDEQCSDGDSCLQNICVPPHCTDEMVNEGETDVDCGGGACPPCANNQTCETPEDCKSKFCDVDTCKPCMGTADCALVVDTYCDDGVCTPQKTLNDVCGGADQCLSNYCVDGVCCDGACDGTCETCAGGNGQCKPVASGADPDGECSDQGAASCQANGTGCNGDAVNPGCNLYPNGTVCDGSTCSMGTESQQSTCDGMGTCQAGGTATCDPYVCGTDSCLASCGQNVDCISTHYCDASGACSLCGADPGGGLTTHNCTNQAPCSSYTCPPGGPCAVTCDGNGACANATIDCPDGYDCTINCTGGNNVCSAAIINCNGASNCDITCSGDNGACGATQVNCGNGKCTGTCSNTKPDFVCGSSCECLPCL